MKLLSIVVPCYNEEESIPLFYNKTSQITAKMPIKTEYIFVNDGSSDETLKELQWLHDKHSETHYISFSRNFGKEAALYAGLQKAKGDYVVVMDADLQDPPEFLPKMYNLLETGNWDCVGTRRVDRKGEKAVKSWLSDAFYKVVNKVSSTPILSGVRDFRMMTRQMVDSVLSLKENNRFSKGLFSWVGYRVTYLNYHNVERVAGESHWSTWKLFQYAFSGIADFSLVPLDFAAWIGGISFIISVIALITIVIRHFMDPTAAIVGWASTVSIILLIGGLQLLCLGIIGRYIGKIFMQVKHRPIYIVQEEK